MVVGWVAVAGAREDMRAEVREGMVVVARMVEAVPMVEAVSMVEALQVGVEAESQAA